MIDVYRDIIERLSKEERSEHFKNKLENNEQLSAEEWAEYLDRADN